MGYSENILYIWACFRPAEPRDPGEGITVL